jgi:hypothetical protein
LSATYVDGAVTLRRLHVFFVLEVGTLACMSSA